MYVFRPSGGAGGIVWMSKLEMGPDNPDIKNTDPTEGQAPRSYWRPRLWVALTTIITFLLGVYCTYVEINAVDDRPTRPLFCLFLLGLIPITLLLEKWRK